MTTIEYLANLYGKRMGTEGGMPGFRCPCPAHGGTDDNCAIFQGDGGKIAAVCHSRGCEPGEILTAIEKQHGLEAINPKGWSYQGSYAGDRHVWRQDRANGSKRFVSQGSRDGVPLRFYPEDGGSPIILCEGEKAARAVQRAGYTGASYIGGSACAGKADYSRVEGQSVAIWPDNDEPGMEAAGIAFQLCREAGAKRVALLQPLLEAKGDAADIPEEARAEAIRARLETAPWIPGIKRPKKTAPEDPLEEAKRRAEDAQREYEEAVRGKEDTNEYRRFMLRKMIGIDVRHIGKSYSQDRIFRLTVARDGSDDGDDPAAEVGSFTTNIRGIVDFKLCSELLAGACSLLIAEPRDPANPKRSLWRDCAQMLLLMAEEEDMGEVTSQDQETCSWIDGFLVVHFTEADRDKAVSAGYPWWGSYGDGPLAVHISLTQFRQYVAKSEAETVSSKAMGARLTQIGAISRRMHYKHSNGKESTAFMWELPPSLFDPEKHRPEE